MDFYIKGKENNLIADKYNSFNVKQPYIPLLHKETKDTVSFGCSQQGKNHYLWEEREKIFNERQLPRTMVYYLKDLDDREFNQALIALDKGYFNSKKQPVAHSLSDFAKTDEQAFKKSIELLDKYREKGVDLSLYTNLNIGKAANLNRENFEKVTKILDLLTPETNPDIFFTTNLKIENIPSMFNTNKQYDNIFRVMETCIKSNTKLPNKKTLENVITTDNDQTERLIDLIAFFNYIFI